MPFEVPELLERSPPRLGGLARAYAWGPKGGDWDTQGKWQVKWLSPFAGWSEAHASVPTLPPQVLIDFTKQSSAYGSYYQTYSSFFSIAAGDDPSHAMLVVRRSTRTDMTPIELEADRAPVEIHRADGEPFLEIDAVTRAAGRWFIVTPPPAGASSPVTTIWQVDGAVARELVHVSRAAVESGRPAGARLARRSDGRAIGLVVDGQPTAERTTATRWVLPVDLETGQLGEPESLGYTDLAGRTLEACTDDVVGWGFDTTLPGTARVRLTQGSGSMHALYVRLRLTTTRACVERVARAARRRAEPGAHRLGPRDQRVDIGQLALSEFANLLVRGCAVVAGRQQDARLVEAEPRPLGDVEHLQAPNGAGCVAALAVLALRLRQDADGLVIANRRRPQPGSAGDLADRERCVHACLLDFKPG